MTREMIPISYDRFWKIFGDKERFKKGEKREPFISFYEIDIIDTTTGEVAGYYTATSWEDTFYVANSFCIKNGLPERYQKLETHEDTEIWKYFKEINRPFDPLKPGLFEFLEDKYVHPYEPNLKGDMPVFEYLDDTEEPYHIPLVDEEE